jgi:hypothetical protein
MISTTRFKARRILKNLARASARLAYYGVATAIATIAGCTAPPDMIDEFSYSLAPWADVKVDPSSGNYSIYNQRDAWTFDGSINQRTSEPLRSRGKDQLGWYRKLAFEWNQNGSLSADIRIYDAGAMLIRQTCGSARAEPPAAFPSIRVPASFHRFGYKNAVFSPPMFAGGESASPRMFFDDAGHAIIISPADNFMTSEIKTDGDKVESQFNPQLENLPTGFTHSTLLVEGDSIHEAWENWGKAMTDLTGKHRPANDATVELNRIGYWTDNGAFYYYHFDPKRGYDGTLLDVAAAYKKLNISLGYLQLDSWWYIKSTTAANGKAGGKTKNAKLPSGSWNCYGGLIEYTAHPFVFPQGLASFQQQLGIPLITHNRWVDVNSFYHQDYRISGVGAVDPKWWDHITDYLKSSGVEVYEQDWLNEIYHNSPQFRTTTWAGDAFMDNMARATRERGMRMQYCMELPQHYLQGSKYDNLTSVRVCADRFERARWNDDLYVSQLASSLGEWPWVDTFNSNEKANLILATLSAGPVGFGDDMTRINAANIATCARADGVIVKPDTAIVPLDRTYLSDATDNKSPMIAAAFTDHGPHRTAYVFAFPRKAQQSKIEFTAHDLDIAGDTYIYEPLSGHGTLVPSGQTFTATFAHASGDDAWAYYIAAPVAPAGIALVGDAGKIATAGKKRISDLTQTPAGISATIEFAPGEKSVTLAGWARSSPTITATGGAVGEVAFDIATRQFRATIAPSPAGSAVTVSFAER